MTKDEFNKLFRYIEEMRSEMNEKFETAAVNRPDMRGAVAELAAQIRDYHQEMIMLTRKVVPAWSTGFTKLPNNPVRSYLNPN